MLNLTLKPKSTLNLILKPREEELEVEATEEDCIDDGLREDLGAIRLATGAGWEIWVEPLNFILKDGTKLKYYSKFRELLYGLLDHRIRYWLTQEKWNRVEVALEKAEEDISEACQKLQQNSKFLNDKFELDRIE